MTVCMTKNIGLSALQSDFFETTDIHRLIRIAFRSSLYICVHRLPHLRRGNPLWLPSVVALCGCPLWLPTLRAGTLRAGTGACPYEGCTQHLVQKKCKFLY